MLKLKLIIMTPYQKNNIFISYWFYIWSSCLIFFYKRCKYRCKRLCFTECLVVNCFYIWKLSKPNFCFSIFFFDVCKNKYIYFIVVRNARPTFKQIILSINILTTIFFCLQEPWSFCVFFSSQLFLLVVRALNHF